jgi:hypothetical protein
VNLTPKNIEDLMMSAALIIFTSSILVAVLAVAYRVAIRPLLGDVAKLRTGLEHRLAEVEEQIRRLNAATGLPTPVAAFPPPEYAVKKRE